MVWLAVARRQFAMNEAEAIILAFLEANPESAFGRKEIARKAHRRSTYEEDPRWADAPLNALEGMKLIDVTPSGHYQHKPRR